jgi:hypothetical protein
MPVEGCSPEGRLLGWYVGSVGDVFAQYGSQRCGIGFEYEVQHLLLGVPGVAVADAK